jgi:hypothetical protein
VEAMGYLTVNQKQARGNHNIKQNMKVINSKINSVNHDIEFGKPRITTSSTGWGFDPLIFAPAGLETSSIQWPFQEPKWRYLPYIRPM